MLARIVRQINSMAFVLLLCCPFIAQSYAMTPEAETLAAINATLEQGDSEGFARLVNVDGIINAAITAFAGEAVKPENADRLPPMLALMFSGAVGQEKIRDLLLQETRAFVLNGVASGAFAGKKLPGGKAQGIFAPLFAGVSLGRKEIRHVGEPAPGEKGSSLVSFAIHDWGNERDYPVVGRFVPLDGQTGEAESHGQRIMRLEAVENLPQIMALIQQEAGGM